MHHASNPVYQSDLQCLTTFDSSYLESTAPITGNTMCSSPPISPSNSIPGYNSDFVSNQDPNQLFLPSYSIICTEPFGFVEDIKRGDKQAWDSLLEDVSFDTSGYKTALNFSGPQILESHKVSTRQEGFQ